MTRRNSDFVSCNMLRVLAHICREKSELLVIGSCDKLDSDDVRLAPSIAVSRLLRFIRLTYIVFSFLVGFSVNCMAMKFLCQVSLTN